MIKYKNLYLIGTSHISKESIKEVEGVITRTKPNFVALELDNDRFNFLVNKDNKKKKFTLVNIRKLGLKVFLLNLVGSWFEKKLGKQVGIEPGSEMKKAIEVSEKVGAKICLIDQNIKYTLNKLISKFSKREKLRLLKDLFFGDKEYGFSIKKIPSQTEIDKILRKIKKNYPSFYLTVITERNEFMARNLFKLMKQYTKEKIVAIVGAGHEKAIIGEIKLLEKI